MPQERSRDSKSAFVKRTAQLRQMSQLSRLRYYFSFSVWWLYFQAVLCICFLFCSAPSKLLFDRRFLFFLLWRGPVCSSVRISSLQFFVQARSSLGFLGSNFLVLHCWNFYRIFFASVIYNLLRGRFHACSRLLSCIANCGLLSFISGLFSRILYCAGLFYSVTKFIIVPVET